MKEKCFKLIVRLFDEEGARYYGEGYLVTMEKKIEGFIALDYICLTPKEDGSCDIVLAKYEDRRGVAITANDMSVEFPNNFLINIKNGNYTKMLLMIQEKISDPQKCAQIIENLKNICRIHQKN